MKSKADVIFTLIVIVYCIYGAVFIWQTSFTINGERYFCLADDAMISMRYAKNFAAGHGLVWNPGGEKVEGITNPLWTVYMSFFHLFPIPASKMSLCIQISGLIFLVINLFFVRKIALNLSGGSNLVALSAVFLTAFFYPLNLHGLRGMEVCILTLFVSAATWLALEGLRLKKFSPLIYFLLAISTFIRPDMLVPYLIFWLFLVFSDKENSRQHWLYGLCLLFFALGSQTVFRLWYYGDILPNTYYLKMTGYPLIYRITRGAYVFWRYFIWERGLIFFFIPFILLFWRRDKACGLLFLVLLGQIFYSLYVGGDFCESVFESNRFIVLAMPAYFILLAMALLKMTSFLKNKTLKNFSYPVLILIIILFYNTSFSLPLITRWLLLKQSEFFQKIYLKMLVSQAILDKDFLSHQAKIAVTWAGTQPYFMNEWTFIDILGKNDRTIAHQKMHLPKNKLTGFVPGHLKWDYYHSIKTLRPDVVISLFKITDYPEDVKFCNSYMKNNYLSLIHKTRYGAFFLEDSANIRWDRIGKIRYLPKPVLKKL